MIRRKVRAPLWSDYLNRSVHMCECHVPIGLSLVCEPITMEGDKRIQIGLDQLPLETGRSQISGYFTMESEWARCWGNDCDVYLAWFWRLEIVYDLVIEDMGFWSQANLGLNPGFTQLWLQG